ncbi:MAG: DUF465 domain-containing protein [Hyphomicrobiaceae bacterium]|nr:DUF465 domain-containing protein [Hyphomicrobiaceae bacterium]MCC0023436.1 DUF465 domain-containing protein [Hyphomicrobiaceae bacterium]
MKNTPHELHDEFPEFADKMSELKTSDAHFSKLFEEYHDVNREVHRGETDVEPMSDDHMTELRRKRMVLKDELYALLSN